MFSFIDRLKMRINAIEKLPKPMTKDIPKAVIDGLTKPKERYFLINLEQSLRYFLLQLHQGPKVHIINSHLLINSYFRLLGHQLCHYYCLQHHNTPNCDIIVTLRENFDYLLLVKDIGTGRFVSVASVLDNRKPDKLQKSEKPENPEIKQDKKDKQEVKNLDKHVKDEDRTNSPRTKLTNSPKTKLKLKPKMLKRDMDKPEEPQKLTCCDADKISNDRDNKEALYMKIRQEIFDREQDEKSDSESEKTSSDDSEDESTDTEYSQAYPPVDPNLVYHQSYMNYNKEMDRIMLNNPYIILPDNYGGQTHNQGYLQYHPQPQPQYHHQYHPYSQPNYYQQQYHHPPYPQSQPQHHNSKTRNPYQKPS